MSADDPVETIARAILYEGYLLYPYRLSSVKNRQRWNFGVLYPPAYCAHDSSERSAMQTECVLQAEGSSSLSISLRFLQQTSNQTIERAVHSPCLFLADLCARGASIPFSFGGVEGQLSVTAEPLAARVHKIAVKAENRSSCPSRQRDLALGFALISTHKVLRVAGGRFVSQTSPPDSLSAFAANCRNDGAWPVLAGDEDACDTMLSAPIILYDFPKIAPQSPGDFFDGTEIDEMLTLRILTLSEDEKREMRGSDPRIRRLLERTETMDERQFTALHGSTTFGGLPDCSFKPGDRVLLRPKGRADIFDIALEGKAATIISIERDFEGQTYVCVTVDDDPGKDLGAQAKPGHRFFFRPEEVELS